jgi:hypothetical protein
MHRGFDWQSAVASRYFWSCTALETDVSAFALRRRKELVDQRRPVEYSRICCSRYLWPMQTFVDDKLIGRRQFGTLSDRRTDLFSLALQMQLTSFRRPPQSPPAAFMISLKRSKKMLTCFLLCSANLLSHIGYLL